MTVPTQPKSLWRPLSFDRRVPLSVSGVILPSPEGLTVREIFCAPSRAVAYLTYSGSPCELGQPGTNVKSTRSAANAGGWRDLIGSFRPARVGTISVPGAVTMASDRTPQRAKLSQLPENTGTRQVSINRFPPFETPLST
jgi:hypothetical protein